jgi:hypothetical protein
MQTLNHTTKYQIAVAITVLKLILNDFINWGMKAAVQHDYPDLKDLARFEGVEEEDVILLKKALNPVSRLFLKYANSCNNRLMDFLNLFAPSLEHIEMEGGAISYANEIYLRLIYDNPMYAPKDLYIDLELFAYSVMHTLHCLCELVIKGSVNLDTAFDHGSSYDQVMDGTWEEYLEHDDHEYKLVANLMDDAIRFYEEIVDLLLGHVE